jgi:hypothetical protein
MKLKAVWLMKLRLLQLHVSNYWEAIGVIAAHKAGIDPFSLRRNKIHNISRTSFLPVNGHSSPRERVTY